MICKCQSDETLDDNDLLFLFKEQNLIDTLNKTIALHRIKATTRFSGNEKGAKFHPTPMPRRPTPPGGPSDCWIEEEDEGN
ncbi:hypothetical protein [Legionella sp. WA2022007384]